MKLYEISESYRDFTAAVENGEIPEEAIADTLEAITGAFEEKTEAVAVTVKNLTAESNALKAEEQALASRRKSKEGRASWLTNYLYVQMAQMGLAKLETPRSALAIKKNPEALIVEDDAALLEWLSENKPDLLKQAAPTYSKTEVSALLKAGEEVPFVHTERKERLEIK
ncbi:MAG TPA: siphovirus Gp157 family protein [Clostridia bacterium]|nr:siphovirus Gp157 family protein [Clostridia bacterium]